MRDIDFMQEEQELSTITQATSEVQSRVKLFNPNPTIRTDIERAITVLENDAASLQHKDYALQFITQNISETELHLALSKSPSLGQWRSKRRFSLLHCLAATQGVKDVEAKIKLICDISKTDINIEDENSLTPLHWAVMSNNFNAVIAIASRYNINFDARDTNGFTALHHLMSCRIEQDDIDAWIASLLSMVGNGAQIPTIEIDETTHLAIALNMQIDNKPWRKTPICQQIHDIIQCCVEFHDDAPDFIENIVNDPREHPTTRQTFSTLLSVHYKRQESLSTPSPSIDNDIMELPNFCTPDLSNILKPTPQEWSAHNLATTTISDEKENQAARIKGMELCKKERSTTTAFTCIQRV